MKKSTYFMLLFIVTVTSRLLASGSDSVVVEEKVIHNTPIPLYTPFLTMYSNNGKDSTVSFMMIIGKEETIWVEEKSDNQNDNQCIGQRCDRTWKLHVLPSDSTVSNFTKLSQKLTDPRISAQLEYTDIAYKDHGQDMQLCTFIASHKKRLNGNFNSHKDAQFKILIGSHPHRTSNKKIFITHQGGAIHLPSGT